MKLEFKVGKQMLSETLDSAITGANYWAQFSKINTDKYGNITSVIVHNHGDEVEEQTPPVRVTLKMMEEGLRRLIQRDFTSKESYNIPAGSFSAEAYLAIADDDFSSFDIYTADIILQCAVFGHVVYG